MLPIFNSIGLLCNKVGFWGKQHAPELMMTGGLLLGGTTVVLACIATAKSSEIIGEAKTELEIIDETLKEKEEYTEEDAKSDRRKVHIHTGAKLAKEYAPAVCTGVASTALILGSTKIMKNRNAVLASSLAASMGELSKIKDRLIEKFGEEEGKQLYSELKNDIKAIEIKEKVTDDNGKTKTVKNKVNVIEEEQKFDGYTRIFDWRNPYWDKDSSYCEVFLSARQAMFNDKLKANGYVFLNEVLEELGFPKTRVGQEVGWVFDPENKDIDNYIDFGIMPVEVVRKDGDGSYKIIENGMRNSGFLLDFNVDGSVLNKAKFPDQEV